MRAVNPGLLARLDGPRYSDSNSSPSRLPSRSPMTAQLLTLTAEDYQAEAGRARWYWRLTDAGGNPLADHTASLDSADWCATACLDLDAYLRQHTAPDRRHDHEQRLLLEMGDWLGRQLLGPIADAIVANGVSTTVRVVVPAQPAAAESL